MQKTLIRFDWAMKRLLRAKSNFDILEGFLSVLLKEDIKIEQILESESNQEEVRQKFNRVDILALNSKKQFIIIEIQNDNEKDYFFRMLFGTSKVVVENLNLKQKYETIKKVYSINIVYFDLGQGEDYVYHGTTEFRGIHEGDILGLSPKQKKGFNLEKVAQIYPEYYIIKVNKFNDLAKDSLGEWIYYLKNDKIKEGSKAKGLKLVQKKLEFEGLSLIERKQYEKDMMNEVIAADVWETSLEEAEEKAEARGVEKAKQLSIIKVLKRGKSTIEEIIEDFEVNEEYVLKLQQEI